MLKHVETSTLAYLVTTNQLTLAVLEEPDPGINAWAPLLRHSRSLRRNLECVTHLVQLPPEVQELHHWKDVKRVCQKYEHLGYPKKMVKGSKKYKWPKPIKTYQSLAFGASKVGPMDETQLMMWMESQIEKVIQEIFLRNIQKLRNSMCIFPCENPMLSYNRGPLGRQTLSRSKQ